MNIAGFEKIAPYLTPRWCYGALLRWYGERKGRLPHLAFFLILLVMGYLSREDKAVWIPAAIAMLGIAAPATNESGNSSVALKDQRGQTPLIISNHDMSVRGRGWPTEWPLSVEQLNS